MNLLQKFAILFNVQPGEGRLVILLMLHYFFLGVGFVFTQAVAFPLFIAAYGTQGLPYAYMAIAIGVSLIAYVYLKLTERLPLNRLLVINLSFLVLVSAAFWLSLTFSPAQWVIVLLPVWFQGLLNLGNLAFWTLTSRLFDVRQGKRLFGLIGSGNWVAAVVGGFVVPPIVSVLGTTSLMALSGISFILAMGLQIYVLKSNPAPFAAVPTAPGSASKAQKRPDSVLKNRYVLLILVMTVLWWISFFFIDNIFYGRASVQFPDPDQLSSFVGVRVAIEGLIALFISLFVTGRFIENYGLRASLLALPSTLAFSIGGLALIGMLGEALVVLFWLAALAKLLSVGLGFSLDNSARLLLFLPLPADQRAHTQTIAEGIVQPLAVGLAGLLLLVFNTIFHFGAVELPFLFMVIVAAWILVVIALMREYPGILARALAKRHLGDETVSLADKSSVAILQQGLSNPYPEAVIYSMNVLEQLQPESLLTALPSLLSHPAPEVRQDALSRIERLQMTGSLEWIRMHLQDEKVPTVRVGMLRTVAALGGSLDEVNQALDDPSLRHGAITGLLHHGSLDSMLVAGQKLVGLLYSPDAAERALAAQILGEIGLRNYYQPLETLLRDPDPQVQKSALIAAGRVQHSRLWPLVIEALARPDVRIAAAQALAAGGESSLPQIQAAFPDQIPAVQSLLVRACGRIRGERVIAFLRDKIDFPDLDVRTQILAALSSCGYHAGDRGEIYRQINREAEEASHTLAILDDLGEAAESNLLSTALHDYLNQIRGHIFYLLSFVHDASSILSARDALMIDNPAQRAYAVELVDTALPQDMKGYLLPLLESAPNQYPQLKAVFPQSSAPLFQRLNEIIAGSHFPLWIRACGLYTVGTLHVKECQNTVTRVLKTPEPLIQETANWALSRLVSLSPEQENKAMLSTIEKVIILKTVDIFAETPDNVLAEVATLLDEVELPAGEVLFKKGDLGDSMYIVVTGKVRVHDGDRILNYRGEREVFGEMALLDPEPRIASITAEEDTHLLRLDQEPFYALMSDRIEVVRGIMRVITANLRARVQDVAELHARIRELEQSTTP